MEPIEMKIKVYRPKRTYQPFSTLTEDQKEEYLKEREQKEYEDDRDLEIWLEDNYSILTIFNMCEKERHDIDNDWRKSCREYVESCFADDYEEEEITLRVEEEDLNKYKSFGLRGID